jgi:hypothetical protein
MPRYAVRLRFASDEDRDLLVPRLAKLVEAGDVTTDDGGARVSFDDVESPIAAIVRAQMLIHGACDGTEIQPASVRRSPST